MTKLAQQTEVQVAVIVVILRECVKTSRGCLNKAINQWLDSISPVIVA